MRALLHRLIVEDEAQDLVEYALLAAGVAFASTVSVKAVLVALHTSYVTWITNTHNCWQMPAPGAGSGC
jgi:hypothetical protein